MAAPGLHRFTQNDSQIFNLCLTYPPKEDQCYLWLSCFYFEIGDAFPGTPLTSILSLQSLVNIA